MKSGVDGMAGDSLMNTFKGKNCIKRDLVTGALLTPSPPIHHVLPTEILAAIFKAGAFLPTQFNERPFPLLVSAICRHWRAVVTNAPDVWTNIQWCISQPCPVLWLRRSRSCLLHITLHPSMRYLDSIQVAIFMSPLTKCAYRWRSLTIEAADTEDLIVLTMSLRGLRAPQLEYVEFRADYGGDSEEGLVQHHVLSEGTASLRTITLSNICLQYAPPLSGVVTTINLHDWLPTAAQFRLLASASSLTTLVLRECTLLSDDEEEYTPVDLPTLISLAISHPKDTMCCQSMLSYLSLPALGYLEIVHATPDDLALHFPADQQPRYPKLHTLRLDSFRPNVPITSLPRALPSITHLQLINTAGTHVLPAPSTHAPLDPRWPALTTISLASSPDNLAWLSATVVTRLESACPLRTVRLVRSSPTSPRLLAWLSARLTVDTTSADDFCGLINESPTCASDAGSEVEFRDAPALTQPSWKMRNQSQPYIGSYAGPPSSSLYAPVHYTTCELFSPGYIQSLAQSLGEIEPRPFSEEDINFERDFGQWFNPLDA